MREAVCCNASLPLTLVSTGVVVQQCLLLLRNRTLGVLPSPAAAAAVAVANPSLTLLLLLFIFQLARRLLDGHQQPSKSEW